MCRVLMKPPPFFYIADEPLTKGRSRRTGRWNRIWFCENKSFGDEDYDAGKTWKYCSDILRSTHKYACRQIMKFSKQKVNWPNRLEHTLSLSNITEKPVLSNIFTSSLRLC